MPHQVRLSSRMEGDSASPITRACDQCRLKKIRCDVVAGGCTQCFRYKTICHFTPISMTRAPRRSGKDKRIEELESRLKSTENQLKQAILNGQTEPSWSDLTDDHDSLEAQHSRGQVKPRESQGIASSPGSDLTLAFDLFPIGGAPFETPGEQCNGSISSPDCRSTKLRQRGLKSLPPKDRMLTLVEKSFDGIHPAYPLFDKTKLLTSLNHTDVSTKNLGQWACINVVLALLSQFEHSAPRDPGEDIEAWDYFHNAFGIIGQLTTMPPTLWSLQALLGLALVIQGTPSQGPIPMLISVAMTLAHRMNLHKRCEDPTVSHAEIEERKRVFWILYSIEKDLSLQLGQPSTQEDDDMDVELPSDIDGAILSPGQTAGVNYFYFRARLAMIQGQIYKRLFSVKAIKQSAIERVIAASELEAMLQSWRATVPLDFLREYQGSFFGVPNSGITGHPIVLQLLYFNTLAIIHNSLPPTPRYHELSTIRYPTESTELQLLSSPLVQTTEARKAIKLLQITPRRRNACIWATLHIHVKAATTLLNSIIDNPLISSALSDLKLIEPLVTLLETLAKSPRGRKLERIRDMYQSCMTLFERAKMSMESANLMLTNWDPLTESNPLPERESIEDFLERMERIGSGHDMELDVVDPLASQDYFFAIEQQLVESETMV